MEYKEGITSATDRYQSLPVAPHCNPHEQRLRGATATELIKYYLTSPSNTPYRYREEITMDSMKHNPEADHNCLQPCQNFARGA
jgi:hypothetical protein